MEKQTLGERGDLLPHGVPAGGEHARNFAFKPWRTSDEKEVCAVRDRNRAMTPASFASEAMAHFLTEYAGVDFSKLSKAERRLQLARAYGGDVFYAWIQLRRQAVGDDFSLQLECRMCRTEFTYVVDLSTMEANVAADGEDLRREVELQDGFTWRGEDVRKVTLTPLRWTFYEGLTASLNTGSMKVRALTMAACALNGKDLAAPLPESALDLTKRDLEKLSATLDGENLGPDLAIEEFCPQCGHRVRQSFPWTYDSFFSVKASGPGAP